MPVRQKNNRINKFTLLDKSNKSGRNYLTGFIKFWLPVLAWMSLIFYFSSIPGRDIPALFAFQDILFHLIIYAVLAYFFSRALKNTYLNFKPLKIIYITVIFGLIYGIMDELHQMFVAGRYASGLDLFIDGLGSFIGGLPRTFLPRTFVKVRGIIYLVRKIISCRARLSNGVYPVRDAE